VSDVITEACFYAVLAEVTWPWAPTQPAIFWLKFFWKLGHYCDVCHNIDEFIGAC